MTKISKLSEFGLETEAKSLKESGMGLYEIARVLTETHPEVKGGFSHMSIKRGLEGVDKQNLQLAIREGQDPIEILNQKFRDAIAKNTNKLDKLVKTANMILNDALENGSISDKTRALKEVRDSLAQIVKNWTALQQYGIQQTGHIDNIQLQKIEEMRNEINIWTDDFSSFSEDLCGDCKKKYTEKLKEKLNKL